MEGDDHGEAYTAIEWSGLLSRERYKFAGAETVENVEGNMLRTVMRGATALPWSKTPLRSKGTRRNLGDLMPPAVATAIPGRFGKARSRSRIGRYEESDGRIVPMKPRTRPIRDRRRRWWREGGRSGERRAAAHAPDPVPEPACPRGGEPADRDGRGRPSPPPRSRSTSDRSPVRESRTPGSARGAGRKARPYRDREVRQVRGELTRRGCRLPARP